MITTSSFSVAAWVNLGRPVDFAAAVSQLGDGGRIVPGLIGVGPADAVHVLIEDLVMRLYLLSAPTGEVMAIEINDVAGGDTMKSMIQVAEDMQFHTGAP